MNKEQLITEVDNLISESQKLLGSFIYHNALDEIKKTLSEANYKKTVKELQQYKDIEFAATYQKWYSKTLTIIKIILPNRYDEFKNLYYPSNSRKTLTLLNYTIFDAIRGIVNIGQGIKISSALNLIIMQVEILKSCREMLEHRLNEISNMLEFDVFEKEIESARYLAKKKYLRSAGAVCGVIIEKHLINMLTTAGESPSKKEPSIGELNDDLYHKNMISGTQYKYLIYLADIRNKCDHNKKTEPTVGEVNELINGTEKVIKTFC